MTPDVASLQYPNAYHIFVLAGCALCAELREMRGFDTFVVVVFAVEATL